MGSKSLRVAIAPLVAGQHLLEESTARYIVRVHRLRAGDSFTAFDPESGLEAQATLRSDRLPAVEAELAAPRPTEARPHHHLTLLQAVGKGDKPDQVIRDATVLGARRVVLVHTERTVAKADGDGRRRRELRIAVEAARQSGRGDVPELLGPCSLDDALRGGQGAPGEAALRLICCFHPQSRPLLRALEAWDSTTRPLELLIGPEGGFSDEEVDAALNVGFAPISLGAFVLRTETAATAALGVIEAWVSAATAG